MYTATKRWLKRNRTNFAIGFGVLGAGYMIGQYAIGKFWEMRERVNNDRIAKENLRRRFVQNQEDCTITVLALLPTAADNILDALPVENITHELQQQRADRMGRSANTSDFTPSEFSSTTPSANGAGEDGKSISSMQTESFMHTSQMGASTLEGSSLTEPPRLKKSKAHLWNELKISSITRALTLIYTLALLTLLTRIQLNLLGRRSYVSSVISLAAPRRSDSTISLENHENDRGVEAEGADFETNRNFLAFSWWLLHRGWRDLMVKVEAAVKEVFGQLSPREEITFQKLSELIIETRKKIEGETEEQRRSQKWLPYLLPPPEREAYVLYESGVVPRERSSSEISPSASDAGITHDASAPGSTNQASTPADPLSSTSQSSPLVTPLLRRLLDETSDIIDSPNSTRTTTLLLDALFSHLIDTSIKAQAFKTLIPSLEVPYPRIQELGPGEGEGENGSSQPPTAKLATILAVMTRQAHAIGSGVPNQYVQAMEGVRELEALSAVVYSSNFGVGAQSDSKEGLPSTTAEPTSSSAAILLGAVPASADGAGDAQTRPVSTASSAAAAAATPGTASGGWSLFEGVWGRVSGPSTTAR